MTKYTDTKTVVTRIQSARTNIPMDMTLLRIERLSGVNRKRIVSSEVSTWLTKAFRKYKV